MPRAVAAMILAGALLVAPAVAAAQSAGDEQYQDPFQGEQEGGGEPQQEPSQEQPQAPAQAAPEEPAPASPAPPAGDSTGSETSADVAPPAQTSAPTLPLTGLPAIATLAGGIGMLAAGAALRRLL
jgi:hypothetical protein